MDNKLRKKFRIFLFCMVPILMAAICTEGLSSGTKGSNSVAAQQWIQQDFSDFRQGESEDGGANLYVTVKGTVRNTYTFDYNKDGANDILFVNAHDINDAPDTYIYLNSSAGLDRRFRWSLLNDGAYSGTVADLNKDGLMDLVLCGTTNGNNKVPIDSYIYYGTSRGFVPGKVTRLPTYFSYSVASGDLNSDGWDDLVFSQQDKPLIVYWNSSEGFQQERKSLLKIAGSYCRIFDVDNDGDLDVASLSGGKDVYPIGRKDANLISILKGTAKGIDEDSKTEITVETAGRFAHADLDKDGHLDLVVCNTSNEPGSQSQIIWGSSKGFDQRPRASLPTVQATGVAIEDLNRDGHSDIVFANQAERDYSKGQINSYVYWGSRQGYSAARRSDLPTEWATQCATGDLNGDGHLDIAFSSRMSEFSMTGKSLVYLGSTEGFSSQRRVELPSHGPLDTLIADVNNDKSPDLVLFNSTSGSNSYMDSVIHWNDGKGFFSNEKTTRLRTWDSIGSAAADFNQDGYVDIVFPNSYEFGKWRHDQGSFIYWGSPYGFSNNNKQILRTKNALTVSTGDLNKDGYLDLLFTQWFNNGEQVIYWGGSKGYREDNTSAVHSDFTVGTGLADLNKDNWLDIVFSNYNSNKAPIYWGGPQGYSKERVFQLLNSGTNAAVAADLNKDGWLDLIMTTYSDSETGGSNDAYSYIYWGSAKGLDNQNRTGLPSVGAVHTTVADLNKDGYLDVVISNENTGVKDRTWFLYIYWNGAEGFSPSRRMSLFTHGGAGSLALDFNDDGWLDLLVSCHKQGSDHRTNSLLFWGGPDGFDETRTLEFPTQGANETTFYDAGNIYHRRFEIGFQSGIYDAGRSVQVTEVSWQADEKLKSKIKFQLRSTDSEEAISSAPWSGPNGPNSYYESSGQIVKGISGRHFQYRALFVSHDGSNYPELDQVTVEYK